MSFDANKDLSNYNGMGVCVGMLNLYQEVIGQHTIEIGYGNADLLKLLKERGNICTGIDASDNNYYTARSKKIDNGLLKLDVSKERLPFPDGIFDSAFAFEIIEHLENPIYALQELKRVTKQDGLFFISIPMPSKIMGYKQGRHAYCYPGLFEKKNFDRFLMQLNFKFIDYKEESYHAYYKLHNKKYDRMDIRDVVNLDIDANKLYGDLNWRDVVLEPIEKGPHD